VVIEGTSDYTEDRLALEVISKAVPTEMVDTIASKPSAKATWELIILRNVGVDRVRKAKASTLKREFDSLAFLDDESVDDFDAHIGRITNQLAVLGFKYKEEEIVRRFLQALPPKFEQIAALIETLLDLETITVGHLKPSEEQINHNGGNTIASLNLTKYKLVTRLSSRLKISGNGFPDRSKESLSSNNKRGRGRDRGRGSGDRGANRGGSNTGGCGGGNAGRSGGGSRSDVAGDECRYCGKREH
jgi:uncharacterized membrane protein YgcG